MDSGLRRKMSMADIIASMTAFTYLSISRAYSRYAPHEIAEVIIGGGGRHNPAIITGLKTELAPAQIFSHEDIGMNSDTKEAVVFAVLAHETWHNRPGNHPNLTGAKHPVVLGQITPGSNYADLIEKTWT